jgi:signal transduction histidine kinase/CheY-like chemotaxis protein
LLVVVGVLALTVEALILRAYFNSVNTAAFFREAGYVTTALANLQRETLLLQLETDRFLRDPEGNLEALQLRRALLGNQINTQTAQARNIPHVAKAMSEMRVSLKEYDDLLAQRLDQPGALDSSIDSQIKNVLARLERQVKGLYDSQELNFFEATSAALQAQRSAELMLLALGAMVLVLGLALAASLGRTFRALKVEMAERARAEEVNRQLTESLERRVIERTAELTDALEQLEDVSRHKSEFLANMSHELRTPLNAIIGYSEMLQEQAEDTDQKELISDLEKIRTSGKHLLEMVNEVLDFSKIEAGKVDLYLETFYVPKMLNDVTAVIQPLAEKNFNTLEVHCAESVGYMHADLTKVRQTLFNLLSNACKFTERGAISVGATRTCEDGVDWISFTVADTGIGITPQQMGNLFQPFSQADSTTTRKYGGTGLGLVVSRNFCRMMGGDITVESEAGKGSVFTCTIPAEVKLVKLDPIVGGPGTTVSPSGVPGLVLVIDDDQTSQHLTKQLLSEAGFRVECASNGAEGLRLARELHPDIIALDEFMPSLDGRTVLTALKSDPELGEIPVIVVTSRDPGAEDRQRWNSSIGKIVENGASSRELLLQELRNLGSVGPAKTVL